uniref:Myeloid leukemia factor n=1 Tax=Globodera pallida TaxID=36090 RepID=A0A183CHJ5_GLOPA
MFGGGGDPFRNPFEHMHNQMRQMDNMMNTMLGDAWDMLNGFGMMGAPHQPMLTDDSQRHQLMPHRQQQPQQRFGDDMMMSPFGGIFGGMMQQMQHMHNRAIVDPNSVVFSESTMVSYDGNGQPKVVQHSTRKAGDVKETRKTLRDGGREEMTVGHSIGERSHIIEKKRNKDGKVRQQQKFVNLDEEHAEEFNRQFKTRARENLDGLFGGRDYRQHAIENGGKYRGGGGKGVNGVSSSSHQHRNSGVSPTPIITVPDDEDDEEFNRRAPPRNRRGDGRYDEDVVYSNSGMGPTIQEINDDEADSADPKRRKGLFGKFRG